MKKFSLLVFLFVSVLLQAQTWEQLNSEINHYYEEGDFENAIKYGLKAIDIAEQEYGKKHSNYIYSLHTLGYTFFAAKEYDKALRYFSEWKKLYSYKEGLIYAYTLGSIGASYYYIYENDSSYSYLKESNKIIMSLKDKEDAQYKLNNTYLKYLREENETRDFKIASEKMNKIKELEKERANYTDDNNLDSSIKITLKILEIFRQSEFINELEEIAYYTEYATLADFYNKKNKLDSSLYFYEKSIYKIDSFYKNNPIKYSGLLSNIYLSKLGISEVYKKSGDKKLYAKFLQELELGAWNEINSGLIDINDNLLNTYNYILSDLMQAYREINDVNNMNLIAQKNINFSRDYHGEYSKEYVIQGIIYSIPHLSESLDYKIDILNSGLYTLQKIGLFNEDYTTVLTMLANSLLKSGDIEKAKKIYNKIDSIYSNNPDLKQSYYLSYLNTKNTYFLELNETDSLYKNYTYLLDGYRRLYGTNSREYAKQLQRSCGFLSLNKKYNVAEQYCIESKDIWTNLGEFGIEYLYTLELLIGIYYERGDLDKCENLISKHFEQKKEYILSNMVWLNNEQRTNFWQINKQNVLPIYLSLFESADKNFINVRNKRYTPEKIKKINFNDKNSTFSSLAYNDILFKKSLLLDFSLDVKNQDLSNRAKILLEKINKKKQELYTLAVSKGENNNEIQILNKEINYLESELIYAIPILNNLRDNLNVNWSDVKGELTDSQAAIEFETFHLAPDTIGYVAFIVTEKFDKPLPVYLCTEYELKHTLQNSKNIKEVYIALHDIVWSPIEKHLDEIDDIFYSPSGQLNHISFKSLINSNDEYLIDKYNLIRLLSTKDVLESNTISSKKIENKEIQIVGNVDYDKNILFKSGPFENREFMNSPLLSLRGLLSEEVNRSGWSYLPGTKEEIEGINKVLTKKNWSVQYLEDDNATENAIKQLFSNKKHGVYHFATHGFSFSERNNQNQFSNYSNPMMRCGVLLSGSNITWSRKDNSLINETGEDGILTAYEVSLENLDNVELVVLSACETGLGKIDNSEGVFGLLRGFKLAGVDNLVVSLWKVPD